MRCFVMNSIDIFGKFYEYCCLVMNYFGFVMNDYGHYYGLVLTYFYKFYWFDYEPF